MPGINRDGVNCKVLKLAQGCKMIFILSLDLLLCSLYQIHLCRLKF